jgi:RNA polymerase sigma-70 factor (ECF subfamily)
MDQQPPTTRLSLLVRLTDARNHEAWAEFTAIYEPLILRLVARLGLQEFDARDVCQEVLTAVAKGIDQWRPDGRDQSFRRWLFRIARNRVIKFLVRERKRPRGSGGSDAQLALEQHQDGRESISELFEREYRQRVLLWAAEQIRGEFRESTWEAFRLSYVEGRAIEDVARQLGMSAGNVYVSRSRIVARLRTRVREITGDED